MNQNDADPPPNNDDWQNERGTSFDDEIPPPVLEERPSPNRLSEEPVERMQLRQRDLAPVPILVMKYYHINHFLIISLSNPIYYF